MFSEVVAATLGTVIDEVQGLLGDAALKHRVTVWPGDVVFDYCDVDCGQIWGRVVSGNPGSQTVTAAGDVCAQLRTVTVEVGVARCVPTGDGRPPADAAIEQAGVRYLLDVDALLCASRRYEFASLNVIPTSGGCSAVAVQFSVTV